MAQRIAHGKSIRTPILYHWATEILLITWVIAYSIHGTNPAYWRNKLWKRSLNDPTFELITISDVLLRYQRLYSELYPHRLTCSLYCYESIFLLLMAKMDVKNWKGKNNLFTSYFCCRELWDLKDHLGHKASLEPRWVLRSVCVSELQVRSMIWSATKKAITNFFLGSRLVETNERGGKGKLEISKGARRKSLKPFPLPLVVFLARCAFFVRSHVNVEASQETEIVWS